MQGNINVGQLGELVGMSRTSFNQRFTKLVGESPKTYLTNFRLQNAKNSLLNNNSPIIQIAENAGYSSEAAFSKAFKRYYKVPPGSVRKKSAERTLDN
ncbi:helix-turn-helix transcriptional regulator [Pseudoalteromonas sp. Z9A5]|uniref:helix-turn-helix domain-containing protein n=1 Tax=Pseudoalteromonas sp. Z9A5 TaxID=2686355 RepID=UPI0023F870BB|nr:helix-turn-helix transcriptional regulator [Pseudoalteromonas sp. Z9A5]